MKKIISIFSIISILLLKTSISERVLHIHINDENDVNSIINGYEMDFTADDENVTTLESSKVSGKAVIEAVNNDSLDISENKEIDDTRSKSTSLILIPVLAMICIYGVYSIGLFIKKQKVKKSKPKRRSYHFEDDDELSKILVQSPAATAVNKDAFTVRNITQEKSIGKTIANKILSKKENSFLPINHAYKVTLPWNPKHLDEIKLKVGDIVCIKKCYSDGYSYGRNVTNRVDGIFPTCCLSSMEESINQAAIQEWIKSGMNTNKKRTTSLFLNDITYKI